MASKTVAMLIALSAGSAALATAYADEIDDDIALFETICLANMPKLAPVRARAKAEGWSALPEGELQTPNSIAGIRVQQAWSFDTKGVRYTIRVAEGQSKMRVVGETARSGDTIEGAVARCSLETPRGAGRETLQHVEKKFGPGKGPFLPFLSPSGSSELDHQWNVTRGDLRLMLFLYRPSAEQSPGARLEIVLNVNPFAGK